MKRILRNYSIIAQKQQQTRYYHYETSGRSVMGSPEEQPAPASYQMGSTFDSYPEIYQGFSHHPQDPYVTHAINLYDNWEYKNYGDWWNLGSIGCNLLMVVYPVLLYLLMRAQHENTLSNKSAGFVKYSQRNGWGNYTVHQTELEPIQN